MNERCKLIQGSFHASKVPPKPRDWRQKLFDRPLPKGWKPGFGEVVILRPGTMIGALEYDRATVTRVVGRDVDVRVQYKRSWKSRLLKLQDVRPA